MKKALILITLLGLRAHSGAFLTTLNGFYYGQSVENQDKSKTETRQSLLSLNLSYLTNSKIIFGVMGFSDSLDTGNKIEKTTGVAPQLGFLIGTWGLEAFMLSQVEYQPDSTQVGKWKEGSGYQVNLVYYSIQSQGLFWGFQWVYRVIDLKKYDNGFSVDENKKTISQTYPQIKLGYLF